jgi:ABC-type polysaccharide/polyol phosphate export permease
MHLFQRARVIARHHELLAAFVQKDFDLRYAGSVLGVLWTQLYPLLLLGVYTFVFSIIFPNSIPRFPLFLFVGIILFNFFSTAIQLSTSSVLVNGNLISKVGFPREIVTISTVLIALVDLVLSHFVLLGGTLVFGVQPKPSWLALPVLVVLLTVLSIGVGLVLATAAVYLRDVRFFVDVGVLLLLFLSPVFYGAASVPAEFAWLLQVNPLATAISAYRAAFLDGLWPASSSWLSLVVADAAMLIVGVEVFHRGQRGFADAL